MCRAGVLGCRWRLFLLGVVLAKFFNRGMSTGFPLPWYALVVWPGLLHYEHETSSRYTLHTSCFSGLSHDGVVHTALVTHHGLLNSLLLFCEHSSGHGHLPFPFV